jgi:hypothetical protein
MEIFNIHGTIHTIHTARKYKSWNDMIGISPCPAAGRPCIPIPAALRTTSSRAGDVCCRLFEVNLQLPDFVINMDATDNAEDIYTYLDINHFRPWTEHHVNHDS